MIEMFYTALLGKTLPKNLSRCKTCLMRVNEIFVLNKTMKLVLINFIGEHKNNDFTFIHPSRLTFLKQYFHCLFTDYKILSDYRINIAMCVRCFRCTNQNLHQKSVSLPCEAGQLFNKAK